MLVSVKGVSLSQLINAKTLGRADTPLHIATRHDQAFLVTELLQHNANLNATNADKNTPLHIAVQHGHVTIAEVLLRNCLVDATLANNDGRSVLHLIAIEQNLEILRMLRKRRDSADVVAGYIDIDGNSPMHYAVLGGNLEIVKQLALLTPQVSSQSTPMPTKLMMTELILALREIL